MRDTLARLIRAAKRPGARLRPIHRRRRRYNVHLQASPSWQLRAERAVELWTRNAAYLGYASGDRPIVVGDLGSGNERLRDVLAEQLGTPFSYQGYDLQPQRPTTIQLDAGRELPNREFDLVFALGLLEYLPDLEDFLARLRRICTFAILSYAVFDSAEPLGKPERDARGWRTHHTRGQLEALSERAGWVAEVFVLVDKGRTGVWLWRLVAHRPAAGKLWHAGDRATEEKRGAPLAGRISDRRLSSVMHPRLEPNDLWVHQYAATRHFLLTARLSNVLKVLAMAMAAIFLLLVGSVEPSEASKKHCHRHHAAKKHCHRGAKKHCHRHHAAKKHCHRGSKKHCHRHHHAKKPCHGEDGSARSLLWGAWLGKQLTGAEAPWDWNAVTAFEQRNAGGKHLGVVHWSSPFYSTSWCGGACKFDTGMFQKVRDRGVVPFFSWANGGVSDADVAAGAKDDYIRSWASAAKSWGHPLFLRYAWEMNGPWFSWGVGNQGTTAADYVAAWRHVHDVFQSVGATNVTWVWCPNVDPGGKFANLASVYPGDSYVDWTCLDGYNGNDPWTSFTDLFGSTYDHIMQIAPSKPMIIGEVGSTESGGSKAQWITDMFAALPTRFPNIRGLLWFDKYESGPGGYTDWPVETSSSSSAAFAAGVGSLASTPPQTSLGKHPKKKTSKSTAKFTFSSDEPGSSFQCKLDKKPFKLCGSPKKYKHLKPKKHVFQVASVDVAGNLDPTPATFKWKVLP